MMGPRRHEPDPARAQVASGEPEESALERGREACLRRAWASAYAAFSRADRSAPLTADNLEAFATSAYMLGRDDTYLEALARAQQGHLEAGDIRRSSRCAFWVGLRHAFRGETALASGWFGRAERLIHDQCECVERGYLLLPLAEQYLATHEEEAAYATATEAAAIAERFGEPDLIAIARHQQGRARLQQERVQEGLALLDEVMVAVTANELSPVVTGLMYCAGVAGCQTVCALERAREWTSALSRWCDEQSEMVAFTGTCLLHRAELLELAGAWSEAIEEARRAHQRGIDTNPRAAAAALYRQAEVHRLRGDLTLAEHCYRSASEAGLDPQPGLSLLLLARGQTQAAATAARRVLATTTDRSHRARVLQPCIEILLAARELDEACDACVELEAIARVNDTEVLRAMAVHARGAIELATGRPDAAIVALRAAAELWQQLDVPYAAARARLLLGLACRDLEDRTGAGLELAAARAVFERLGAIPDVRRVDALAQRTPRAPAHGLSRRELEVLRLIASGHRNKAIASTLGLSEKTIERHVTNLFRKVGVQSRAAATAFAYEHRLLDAPTPS